MTMHAFRMIDVFASDGPFSGNPLAGHPTLGTARAWLDAGGVPRAPGRLVQECGVGLVPVRIDDEALAFAAPRLVDSGPMDDASLAVALSVLGVSADDVVDARVLNRGTGRLGVLLRDVDAVLALEPNLSPRQGRWCVGAVGLYDAGSDNNSAGAALEVRAFFNATNGPLREDPVTGSLNASLAHWLTSTGRVKAPYLARQGVKVGRDGRVSVTEAEGELWIGGRAVVTVSGDVEI